MGFFMGICVLLDFSSINPPCLDPKKKVGCRFFFFRVHTPELSLHISSKKFFLANLNPTGEKKKKKKNPSQGT